MNSNLPIFSFMDYAFIIVSKNSSPNTRSQTFTYVFFKNFIVFQHINKYMVHIEGFYVRYNLC